MVKSILCESKNINKNKDFAFVHGGEDIDVHTIVFIIPKTKWALLIFTNSDNSTEDFAEILVKFLKGSKRKTEC